MKRLLAGLILAAPVTCFAANEFTLDINGFLGHAFSEISDDGFSVKPDGLDTGFRATISHREGLFALGEYTFADLDDRIEGIKLGLKIHEFRVGGGYLATISPQLKVGGYGAYVGQDQRIRAGDVKASDDADGFNIGGLIQYNATKVIQTYGRFGYLNLEADSGGPNADGVDLIVGGSYELAQGLAGFVEYRYTHLQQSGGEVDYNSIRGGIKLSY